MKQLFYFLLLLGTSAQGMVSPALLPAITSSGESHNKQISVLKRSDKRLQALEKERAAAQAHFKDLQPMLGKIAVDLDVLKRSIGRAFGKKQEFLKNKISLLSQTYQVLAELDQVQQQLLNDFDTHIKSAQEYAADEEFASLRVPVKAYYDFDEVQGLAQKLLDMKARLLESEKNKLAVIDDINKRKRSLALIQDEFKEKKKQQESFASQIKSEDRLAKDVAVQQGELLDLEVQLAEFKKELAELKIMEAERRLALIEDLIVMYKAQLGILKKEYSRVQRSARVSPAYVKQMEEQLETKRQAFVAKSDRFNDKMRVILADEVDIKQRIQQLQQRLHLSASDIASIRSLNRDPQSIAEWQEFMPMLALLAAESFLEIEREVLVAQMDLEKAHFRQEELEVSAVRTWFKMTSEFEGFRTDEEVDQEIKMYLLNKAELEAQIVALTNARDAAINGLQVLNASLDRIKQQVRLLQNQRDTIFRNEDNVYKQIATLLYEVEERKRRRLNWVAKLIETYSTIIIAVQANVKKVESIIDELKTKGFWRRSDQSIKWNRLNEFVPDMQRFGRDIRNATFNFVSTERIVRLKKLLITVQEEPLKLLLLLVNALIVIILFFMARLFLPDIIQYFARVNPGYGLLRYVCRFISVGLSFLAQHFVGIYFWSVGFTVVYMGLIRDAYLEQLFYLLSIPYLVYLAYQFFAYFEQVNRQRNFVFISEAFQARFFFIMTFATYAIMVLALMRESFLLGGYRTSQVPVVLSALIFIFGQLTLMSLLGRSQIIGALRSDTPLWEWIYEHVNQYYYFVWIVVMGIIAMSNPYVGYGRQVLYIVSRLLLTLALIPLFSWVHNRIKRTSLDLFFYYTESDEIKERFVAGKFWYGLFVISSLILFLVAGFYIGARIWGTSLTLRDMTASLNYSFYSLFDESGREVSVTVSSLLQILLYVFGGIVVATIINRLILRRALDPFLVDPGIQNTVLTIIRYIIVIIAVFMGLSSAGLEGLTTKLAILLAGIGFAAQEAVKDFFSYFVLLVQRPIKIGDLIEIVDTNRSDRTLMGVVRHITPRSIMIRRNNSMTVIIPNSRVVMNPVINWSYSRSFIAFDEILMTVPFGTDPSFVRKLVLEILDKNSNILKSPAPIVRLNDFTENGFQFLIRGFLTSDKVFDQWDIASEVRLELVRQLRAQGIEVASPIRTLKVLATEQASLSGAEKKERS